MAAEGGGLLNLTKWMELSHRYTSLFYQNLKWHPINELYTCVEFCQIHFFSLPHKSAKNFQRNFQIWNYEFSVGKAKQIVSFLLQIWIKDTVINRAFSSLNGSISAVSLSLEKFWKIYFLGWRGDGYEWYKGGGGQAYFCVNILCFMLRRKGFVKVCISIDWVIGGL